MDSWLVRWERQNWRTDGGRRVSHTDLWSKILGRLRRFSEAPGKVIEILHVKGHAGNKGNERADKLSKLGC